MGNSSLVRCCGTWMDHAVVRARATARTSPTPGPAGSRARAGTAPPPRAGPPAGPTPLPRRAVAPVEPGARAPARPCARNSGSTAGPDRKAEPAGVVESVPQAACGRWYRPRPAAHRTAGPGPVVGTEPVPRLLVRRAATAPSRPRPGGRWPGADEMSARTGLRTPARPCARRQPDRPRTARAAGVPAPPPGGADGAVPRTRVRAPVPAVRPLATGPPRGVAPAGTGPAPRTARAAGVPAPPHRRSAGPVRPGRVDGALPSARGRSPASGSAPGGASAPNRSGRCPRSAPRAAGGADRGGWPRAEPGRQPDGVRTGRGTWLVPRPVRPASGGSGRPQATGPDGTARSVGPGPAAAGWVPVAGRAAALEPGRPAGAGVRRRQVRPGPTGGSGLPCRRR